MRTWSLLSLCALMLVCPAELCAQVTPAPADFSGTWKLNPARSKFPKGASIQSEVVEIRCSGLSIQMTYSRGAKQSSHSYIADGKERKLTEASRSGEVVAKAHWKKGVLIIETTARLKMPDEPEFNGSDVFRSVEQWTISSDGRTLTMKDSGTVFVYDKQ